MVIFPYATEASQPKNPVISISSNGVNAERPPLDHVFCSIARDLPVHSITVSAARYITAPPRFSTWFTSFRAASFKCRRESPRRQSVPRQAKLQPGSGQPRSCSARPQVNCTQSVHHSPSPLLMHSTVRSPRFTLDSPTLGDEPQAAGPSEMNLDSAPEGELSPFTLLCVLPSPALILRAEDELCCFFARSAAFFICFESCSTPERELNPLTLLPPLHSCCPGSEK